MPTAGNELGEINNQPAESHVGCELPTQQQPSATFPSKFPPELIDHIVDHLHDDKQALIRCSRAHRVFSHATSYHLLRTVSIASVPECVEFQELIWSSLHPLPSTSTPHLSSSPSAASSPTQRTAHQIITQVHPRSTHVHPYSDRPNPHPHARHTCTPNLDVPAAGWDISRFVRKIEFQSLDHQSTTEEYVSEAVKLVRMLPRIREVTFGWWTQSTGMDRIGRAFAPILQTAGDHGDSPNQPLSSALTNAFSETRVGQAPANDPLKLHLEQIEFESVHKFLDLLESFGGRVRELSLSGVTFGGPGGDREGNFRDRCLPGIECVSLGYEAVVRQKASGPGGPAMGILFGMSAFNKTYDVCDILESIAPNVNDLQLFRDDVGETFMCLNTGARTARSLRLPRFQKLKSVTMCVPGPSWSDLIYEIAAWFARGGWQDEIADTACQYGRASPPSFVTTSMPSSNAATRANHREDRKRTKVRFFYPVGKRNFDWGKLESAVLGEDFDSQGGTCSRFGNRGGKVERESRGGSGNDHIEMMMRINRVRNRGAGGSRCTRFMGSLLCVEVGSGSVVPREELGRLDELELLQVSWR